MRRLLVAILVLLIAGATQADAGIPPHRQTEILYLLKHDCGSCHGMRLEGGLGPALTPQRLAPYEVNFLVHTIVQGRPGTPMPPWYPFLSDNEARWLAEKLKQGVDQ